MYLYSIFIICTFIHTISSSIDMRLVIMDCMKTENVSEGDQAIISTWNGSIPFPEIFTTSRPAQCLMKCILQEVDAIDEDGYIVPSIVKKMLRWKIHATPTVSSDNDTNISDFDDMENFTNCRFKGDVLLLSKNGEKPPITGEKIRMTTEGVDDLCESVLMQLQCFAQARMEE